MTERGQYGGYNFDIIVRGAEAMKQVIQFVYRESSQFEKPLQELQNYFMDRNNGVVYQNFRTRGAFFGKPWAPLRQSTLKEKERLAHEGKMDQSNINVPMVRTGGLKESFRGRIITNRTGETQLVIDNTSPYFQKHHSRNEGTRRIIGLDGHSTVLPRRVMLRITSESREQAKIELLRHLSDSVRRRPRPTMDEDGFEAI